MTAFIMHHNERIFPDSWSFVPERWAERDGGMQGLERYMVSFSKGSRQCVGLSLAKAEISITLATLFHRYRDMELFDTSFERDVRLTNDMFLPQPSKESRGIRVVFK
ncbi:Cyrochrome P450 monooxygenase [Lachnellula arida]|uniref:Cyrochrome P450 monooxygenase n=1 Tax=Lachnellula arida TaxID=1316785 RepID=A0A8T9B869_9HELO|nr:Cyrochrome P450 monooxygenase [Lachnellula arida]